MEAQPQKKRKLCSYSGPDPSVEEIEAEFWRIVESPDEVRLPPPVRTSHSTPINRSPSSKQRVPQGCVACV